MGRVIDLLGVDSVTFFQWLEQLPTTEYSYSKRGLAVAAWERQNIEYREKLASWMIEHGFATGHGDTFDELLSELQYQISELRES